MSAPTVTVETQIPQDVFLTLQAHGLHKDSLAVQSRELLALRFFKGRVLSLGKAARLAGMTRPQFIQFLSDNAVAVIDLSEDELSEELAVVNQLSEELGE